MISTTSDSFDGRHFTSSCTKCLPDGRGCWSMKFSFDCSTNSCKVTPVGMSGWIGQSNKTETFTSQSNIVALEPQTSSAVDAAPPELALGAADSGSSQSISQAFRAETLMFNSQKGDSAHYQVDKQSKYGSPDIQSSSQRVLTSATHSLDTANNAIESHVEYNKESDTTGIDRDNNQGKFLREVVKNTREDPRLLSIGAVKSDAAFTQMNPHLPSRIPMETAPPAVVRNKRFLAPPARLGQSPLPNLPTLRPPPLSKDQSSLPLEDWLSRVRLPVSIRVMTSGMDLFRAFESKTLEYMMSAIRIPVSVGSAVLNPIQGSILTPFNSQESKEFDGTIRSPDLVDQLEDMETLGWIQYLLQLQEQTRYNLGPNLRKLSSDVATLDDPDSLWGISRLINRFAPNWRYSDNGNMFKNPTEYTELRTGYSSPDLSGGHGHSSPSSSEWLPWLPMDVVAGTFPQWLSEAMIGPYAILFQNLANVAKEGLIRMQLMFDAVSIEPIPVTAEELGTFTDKISQAFRSSLASDEADALKAIAVTITKLPTFMPQEYSVGESPHQGDQPGDQASTADNGNVLLHTFDQWVHKMTRYPRHLKSTSDGESPVGGTHLLHRDAIMGKSFQSKSKTTSENLPWLPLDSVVAQLPGFFTDKLGKPGELVRKAAGVWLGGAETVDKATSKVLDPLLSAAGGEDKKKEEAKDMIKTNRLSISHPQNNQAGRSSNQDYYHRQNKKGPNDYRSNNNEPYNYYQNSNRNYNSPSYSYDEINRNSYGGLNNGGRQEQFYDESRNDRLLKNYTIEEDEDDDSGRVPESYWNRKNAESEANSLFYDGERSLSDDIGYGRPNAKDNGRGMFADSLVGGLNSNSQSPQSGSPFGLPLSKNAMSGFLDFRDYPQDINAIMQSLVGFSQAPMAFNEATLDVINSVPWLMESLISNKNADKPKPKGHGYSPPPKDLDKPHHSKIKKDSLPVSYQLPVLMQLTSTYQQQVVDLLNGKGSGSSAGYLNFQAADNADFILPIEQNDNYLATQSSPETMNHQYSNPSYSDQHGYYNYHKTRQLLPPSPYGSFYNNPVMFHDYSELNRYAMEQPSMISPLISDFASTGHLHLPSNSVAYYFPRRLQNTDVDIELLPHPLILAMNNHLLNPFLKEMHMHQNGPMNPTQYSMRDSSVLSSDQSHRPQKTLISSSIPIEHAFTGHLAATSPSNERAQASLHTGSPTTMPQDVVVDTRSDDKTLQGFIEGLFNMMMDGAHGIGQAVQQGPTACCSSDEEGTQDIFDSLVGSPLGHFSYNKEKSPSASLKDGVPNWLREKAASFIRDVSKEIIQPPKKVTERTDTFSNTPIPSSTPNSEDDSHMHGHYNIDGRSSPSEQYHRRFPLHA